ncbi:MAG: RagB/SusD family nutrient uptake outer membrane protein [Prevotellaceae bacterium]|jgi:hypothetical protein|nr:RagB/SusD family nutrient uptake outer membrane protein [Prevotellaceae bacterium]
MKNLNKIAIAFLVAALCACESFLDKLPDDQVTGEEVFSRYEKVNALVTDLYQKSKMANRPLVFFNHFSSAPVTDECEGSTAEASLTNKFNDGDWSASGFPDRSSCGQYWWDLYTAIRSANVILEGVAEYNTPDNPNQEGDLGRRIGEVYFFRGYLHYLLFRMYGEVPYIDHTVDPQGSMDFYKESAHSLVEKIVADANEAYMRVYDKNVQTSPDFGRVDKGACLGLIAMVRWMAATPLWNGAREKGYQGTRMFEDEYAYDPARWERARDAAKAVLDFKVNGQPRYKLYTAYDNTDFFDNGGENHNSSTVYRRLWRLFYDFDAFEQEYLWFVTRDKNSAWAGDVFNPDRGGSSRQMPVQEQVDEYEYISTDGYGYPVYSADAVSAGYNDENPYVRRDPRFYRDIVYHGAPWRDRNNNDAIVNTAEGSDRINAQNATKTGYYLRKLIQEKSASYDINGPAIWRLPEIIYIYCEAVNESSGPTQEIYDLLNQVRARSFMAPIPVAAKSDKALMNDYIQRERRVELFYENNRIWTSRLLLEPNSATQLTRENQWKAAGTTNDERSQNYWKQQAPYPKCQRMINGMRPVEDVNGPIDIGGKKYKMERFCVEERRFETPHYLFPIMNDELQRSPTLVQNPGW